MSRSEDGDNQSDDDSKNTPEEIAFDNRFRKWEEQVTNWKANFADHPDRKAYNDYESEMEKCRSRMLQCRAEMRQRQATATVLKAKIVDHADIAPVQNAAQDDEIENEIHNRMDLN